MSRSVIHYRFLQNFYFIYLNKKKRVYSKLSWKFMISMNMRELNLVDEKTRK